MIIRLANTDKGEYELQQVEVFNEETGETETVQQEVCVREPYVIQDIRKIINWNGGRQTVRLTKDGGNWVFGNKPHISGARIDVLDAGDRIIVPAEYDSEGELITPAIMGNEIRADIHVPDDYDIPNLITQVTPNNPDKNYAHPVSEKELDHPKSDWDIEDIRMWAKVRNIPYSDALDVEEMVQVIADYFQDKQGVATWEEGVWLEKDTEIIDGTWYKVNIGHHTQNDWRPPNSLFTQIAAPADIPVWVQPEGAHDAYSAGYIVEHDGKLWQSNHPDNVWEPGTGNLWAQLTEDEEAEIPEWSSFASHEFQHMTIGTTVMDDGTIYYLINPAQGHWQPSGAHGHHGWSTTES